MTGTALRARGPALAAGHRLWRLWLGVRFRLFQRGRHDALVLEEVAGLRIVVLPQVFNPKLFWTGELLARLVERRPPARDAAVLDLGTGSGIGALAAGRWAGRVVAVDINPAAERCARINVLLNELEDRVEVRGGDLWEPVQGERFDLVLFNPPFYPGVPRDGLDHAFRAGDVPRRFARGLAAHLRPGGHALVVLSSAGDAGFLAELRNAGLTVSPEAEERRVGEVLTAYRVQAEGPQC
ncbi:MAG: methyltransferase [Gaiellaceae bacterium]